MPFVFKQSFLDCVKDFDTVRTDFEQRGVSLMDETSQTDEAAGTIKVFCVSALVILAGLLTLVFLFGGMNGSKAQIPTFRVTQH